MHTFVAEILIARCRTDRLAGALEPGSAEHAAATEACARLHDLDRDIAGGGHHVRPASDDIGAILSDLAPAR